MNKQKHAVILSGGGAHGAFEVGVLKALCSGDSPVSARRPLEIDIFTGTSVGSFNAAFMVSQPGASSSSRVADLEKIWLERIGSQATRENGVFRLRGNPLEFLDLQDLVRRPLEPFLHAFQDGAFLAQESFRRGANFFRSSGGLLHRTLALFNLSTFVVTDPLQQLIRETISLQGIRDSDKVLKIIATDWTTGETKVFSNRELIDRTGHDMILASTAIPGFFPPVEIDGHPYVDGGVVMNTPLIPAIDSGADIIHMVYLDPDVRNIPLERLQNTLDTLDRMLTVQFAVRINEDIATADWINRGLAMMERLQKETPEDLDQQSLIRVIERIARRGETSSPYRKLTIHRYSPSEDLGEVLGLLNFDRTRLADLIAKGFKNAAGHDCQASECLVPAQSPP